MTVPVRPDGAGRDGWVALALLWLAGNALRLTILAVPPVIPAIRDEFELSATQVGLLSSIPPALFAVAALAGSLLVARLGVRAALLGGLIVTAAGSSLRGLSAGYAMLFATTTLMSVGVAILQPIMPTAVRQWLPARIGLGTAVYTNGLLAGEVFPVLLTLGFVLPALGGGWRSGLVFWSLPVALIALAVIACAPRSHEARAQTSAIAKKWLPDWSSGLVWRLGALLGCVNAIYFSANAFIPLFLTKAGRPELVGAALLALNIGQVPASFLLLGLASRLERRIWPFVASGLGSIMAVAGLVLMPGQASVFWAAVLGFSDAVGLILGLTLPALMCREEDVARTSAGMFTLSYTIAVVVAVVSGVAWDLTGTAALAFLPLAVCACGLAAFAMGIRRT